MSDIADVGQSSTKYKEKGEIVKENEKNCSVEEEIKFLFNFEYIIFVR